MFNYDARISLREFAAFGDVVREVAIFGVGKLASRVPARIVPVTSTRALKEALSAGGIAAVATTEELAGAVPESLGLVVAEKPLAACFHIHAALTDRAGHFWNDYPTEIDPSARIHPSSVIAEKNVRIGSGCMIDAGVIVAERTVIGANTRIGCNTVIGSDAFELVEIDGLNRLQAQAGGVRIGTHCVFLSGSAVARSCFATFTEIGENCAVDNLVHVAHDCRLEPGTQVTAGAILAGRVLLGPGSYIGPNATVSNGVEVEGGGQVSIGACAIRDVPAGAKVSGNFAVEHRRFMRHLQTQFGRPSD